MAERHPLDLTAGIRPLDMLENRHPFIRRGISIWLRSVFSTQGHDEMLNDFRTFLNAYENFIGQGLDPLFYRNGEKFFNYVRVTRRLSPFMMDEYLNSLVVTDRGFDLAKTSKILLDKFNLESYREQKILIQKRTDLLEFFSQQQIELSLKFEPRELTVVRDIIQLGEPQRGYIRALSNAEIGLYKNLGGEKLRQLTLRDLKWRQEFAYPEGNERISRDFPEINDLTYLERRALESFTNSRRAMDIDLEVDDLIEGLHDFSQDSIDYYRRLTIREMIFLNNLNQANLDRIVNFQERGLVPLVLNGNQKRVIEKMDGNKFVRLTVVEKQVYDAIPEIFDKSSRREVKIWRNIARLTDAEVGRLTLGDLNLIAVHPKLREPEMLRKYVNLDGAERTRIVNSHREFGGVGELSDFGQSLLHEYIQANLAPTIWSGNDRTSMLRKLKNQILNNRVINTKLLATVSVMESMDHNIADELQAIGEPPVAYVLRWLQYCGLDRTEHLPYVRKIIFENGPESRKDIFNFADPEDVEFVESMIRDSLVIEDTAMFHFLIPTVVDSGHAGLIETLRTGLMENGYRGTKILYFEDDASSSLLLTRILEPEDVFNFFQLHQGNYGEPEMNFFQWTMEDRVGDPIPLLRTLDHRQSRIIFEQSRDYLRYRPNILRYFTIKFDSRRPVALDPERVPLLEIGCRRRRERNIGYRCIDSRNERTAPERLSKTMKRVEKVASRVGVGFTVFTILKHTINGDVKGISVDIANVWAMPKFGQWITSKMLRAKSLRIRAMAPAVGRAVGSLLAVVGLYQSIGEYSQAKDNFDKAIARLHFISNIVFIGSEFIPWPIGLAISVATFITVDIIENIIRVAQSDQEYAETFSEKVEHWFYLTIGAGEPKTVTQGKTARSFYEEYIEYVLSSFQNEHDRVVIYLPDIMVTEQKLRSKFDPDGWAVNIMLVKCTKRYTKILNHTFFKQIGTNYIDYFNNVSLTSRNIPNRIQDFYLTSGPTMDVVLDKYVNAFYQEFNHSEKCAFMPLRHIAKLLIRVQDWSFEKNVIAYNRFWNTTTTMYYIPIATAGLKLVHDRSIDVYFEGGNIDIVAIGKSRANTTNQFVLTNNLIKCDIQSEGTNLFVIKKNNFTCNLRGGRNVGIVKADFKDAKGLDEIVGSEDTEELLISYAKRVDGRGGNDTIIGTNYTYVRSYWGDWIIGKTFTILPLNVSEIDKIVYDKGFIIYNDKNQFVAIDEESVMIGLDSFVLTPSKTDNEIHLYKVVDKNLTLEEGLKELRGIKNEKFKIVKQLSSRNYEIMLGDSGNNVFYPEKQFVNFYWEGTEDVYLFPRINANITISRANGVLDFHLLPEAYQKIVIEPQENNDFVITYENLRVRVLNNYENISFALNYNRDYKLNNWKLVRDYCSKPLRITGTATADAKDLYDFNNCFDFESKKIRFYEMNKHVLLTAGKDSLTISNYTDTLDLAVRVNGEIVITPDEFNERVSNANVLNVYTVEEKLEIYHNQPENQNKIGMMDFGNRSIVDIRGVIGDKDLNIEYKNESLVLVRNWMILPEARKMMFVFNECTINNDDCIFDDKCPPGGIVRKLEYEYSDSWVFQTQACRDNVALICLLVKRYTDERCPKPKFQEKKINICAEAFGIVEEFKKELLDSGLCSRNRDCYSLYERVVEKMRNEDYSGIDEILKVEDVGGDSENTLIGSVKKMLKKLFKGFEKQLK